MIRTLYLSREPKNENVSIKAEPDHNTKVNVKQEPLTDSLKKESTVKDHFQTVKKETNERRAKVFKNCPLKRRRRNYMTNPLSRGATIERAVKIHNRLSAINTDSLTKRQLTSLTWSEKVILKEILRRIECNGKKPLNEYFQKEPAISGPDDFSKDIQIIPYTEQSINLEEDVHMIPATEQPIDLIEEDDDIEIYPDTLMLAVVDFGTQGGRYSFEQSILIMKALSAAVVQRVLEKPHMAKLSYGSSCWHDGVLILDCKNLQSYHFAKAAVEYMKLWDNSDLRAVSPQRNPFLSMARIDVTDFKIDREKFLAVLSYQNPNLQIKNWRIFDDNLSGNGCKAYTLLISEPPALLLQNKQINVFYGAGEVTLKLIGCHRTEEV